MPDQRGFEYADGGVSHSPLRRLVSQVAPHIVGENESVSFFPSYGRREAETWRLRVHGWLYENQQRWRWRKRFIRWLQRGLRLSPAEERSELLAHRLVPFLVNGGGGRRIAVRVAGREFTLPESNETGHVEGAIDLEAKALDAVGRNGWIDLTVPDAHGRRFDGRVQLVEPEGLSVVSDLDDTIKDSNVRVRRELLANTFLRPFAAVPGMAEAYRGLAARGAVFHYVSNSPWQLVPMLTDFLDDAGFPRGSMQLRPFRIRRGGLRRFLKASEPFKCATLETLFEDFPRRRFVLVGDSSERDPEIYGELARTHPDRIDRILIRNITGERTEDERFQAAFRGVPGERWQTFLDPTELAAALG